MGTTWRCPRCGSIAVMEPQYGSELLAVYDLCRSTGDPRSSRMPTRMEQVVDIEAAAIPAQGRTREREKVLAR